VEDQEDVRKLAKEILECQGYLVLAAANGAEAIVHAERHTGPIELMLTDVVMPRMSGCQLADRLKLLRPAMKVVYMSGYAGDAVAACGLLDSAAAYLQKPFTPQDLAVKVRKVLQSAPSPTRVLVVDDEPGIRDLIRQYLEVAGYEVLEAEDGRKAVGLAKTHCVDLMITDLVMPEQEGIETIRLLNREQPGLKIIAMSGASDAGNALRGAPCLSLV
jgi:CheY-like chemotaxis protein